MPSQDVKYATCLVEWTESYDMAKLRWWKGTISSCSKANYPLEKSASMILGVGVDIVSIGRVKDAVETGGKVFLDKVFTAQEQRQAEIHGNPTAYLAMTFASKEAIFKSFAMGWETGVELTEIEIRHGESGEPIPLLIGKFAELASQRGVSRVLLSPSYDGDNAVAIAILV